MAYNKKHGITPKTIHREIGDIREMLGARDEKDVRDILKIELTAEPHEIEEVIKEKEAEMKCAARDLDFETAAIASRRDSGIKKGTGERHPALRGRGVQDEL